MQGPKGLDQLFHGSGYGAIAIAVSQGSTIDMTVIRELFENILEAGSILEADSPADVDLLNRIQIALPKLLPYQIGSSGEIKEWNNDYSIVDTGIAFVLDYWKFLGDKGAWWI
ncbi:hypothetical protein GC098_16730 [Paenibacillus sp. LMG 31458]|uniref:Glycosyl hydrolase family 95 catalytic domain-containing protein n=1 Tax=Paenibacillus phytorum TaxID=2654977 RepID=A0ABX1XXN3_9BACL|nr:hypothetical protein [Paenibacillus phytorum]NOU73044.1 hypothetical protein [Paenibacillus phytorum]